MLFSLFWMTWRVRLLSVISLKKQRNVATTAVLPAVSFSADFTFVSERVAVKIRQMTHWRPEYTKVLRDVVVWLKNAARIVAVRGENYGIFGFCCICLNCFGCVCDSAQIYERFYGSKNHAYAYGFMVVYTPAIFGLRILVDRTCRLRGNYFYNSQKGEREARNGVVLCGFSICYKYNIPKS